MIVKCERELYILHALGFFVPLIYFILLDPTFAIIFSAFLWTVVLPFFIIDMLWVGRTLIFTENGCEISILWIRKQIPWSEITDICIKSCGSSRRFPYDKVIIFSTKPLYKPSWMDMDRSGFFEPFSYFRVYIPHTPPYKDRVPYEYYYPDENEFLSNLNAWGVEVLNSKAYYRRLQKRNGKTGAFGKKG